MYRFSSDNSLMSTGVQMRLYVHVLRIKKGFLWKEVKRQLKAGIQLIVEPYFLFLYF